MNFKSKVYRLLSPSQRTGDLSWLIDTFIISLIILNVLAIILESIQPLREAYRESFHYFEIFSVIIFTIEYILRIWTANEKQKYQKPFLGNLAYAFSAMAMIDFLAILPFYLPLLGIDLRFLRIMRLFRLFRIFKIVRYIKALAMMRNVLKSKSEELTIALIFTFFMLLITSALMYYVENAVQPKNFASIPETMWWSIATLTTVGYGDVYPITGLGKFLGGIIAVLGVGLFALPAGILASGFSEALSETKRIKMAQGKACPYCGKEHDD